VRLVTNAVVNIMVKSCYVNFQNFEKKEKMNKTVFCVPLNHELMSVNWFYL